MIIVEEIDWPFSEFSKEEFQEIISVYSAATGKVTDSEWLKNYLEGRIVFQVKNRVGFICVGIIIIETLEERESGVALELKIITQMKEKMTPAIKKVAAKLLEDEDIGAEELVIKTTDASIASSAARCGFVSRAEGDIVNPISVLVLTREKYLSDKRNHTGHKDSSVRIAKTNVPAAQKPHSLGAKPIPEIPVAREKQIKILEVLLEHSSGIFQNLIKEITDINKQIVSSVICELEKSGLLKREFYKGTYRIIPKTEKIRQKLSECGVKMQNQSLAIG